MTQVIYGLETDDAGRCVHYHQENDIAGLKCQQCQAYFACYQCHDALCDHKFVACDKDDDPVMCGLCHTVMSFAAYQQGTCPNCRAAFNPKCEGHWGVYFK
ncbi:hypothetical protein AYR62_11820 [Secundilactobacillus paracollinoides]|uniref:CHY-type domain-containing protein n=1 Tax=Secundilactobacillus paracollinoides TaxID=240427 RepID=A0A1B2IXR6_9LACO|nr:CHY zinc finger protein [Secundilactobacillus paracollinoides]ANZ60939.1 hypothetical protein AYR61_06010 [Secundilactobacillus paracollinoides]ANZ64695.1 hypothetical protein AYR62_11820 [Secundilactobacillus paracollinoides]ANZ66798.1 hypothetical protein AYR63_06380 [Secundilactobacillus paracollinoides]KRL80696.1 hypothetical protein FC17_GL003058 [Secundilactobacillus paracollinoides DSM 15502 = JCM 11969]